MIEQFRKLHPDILKDFRKDGKSSAIQEKLKSYIIHIDRAVEIYRFDGNISRAARTLEKEFPELSFNTARSRIYDALNIFHVNSSVRNSAWDNYYADKMEDLAKLSIAADNITEARRCMEKAHMFRTKEDDQMLNPDDFKMKQTIVSPNIDHTRLGIGKHDLKIIFKESVEMIESRDIERPKKDSLINEVALATGQTIDTEYEDVTD
ncbi:MAG: hypothetical protein PF448_13080 [Bacteroidales bacterium]|jgi:hypothetical protein|nr:hypothetical protein [Bacteroidales bacterium]